MTTLADLSHLNRADAQWDSAVTWADYKRIIERHIDNQPRSLQKAIGPSELGNPCDRCLISKLGGLEESKEPGTSWLPFIGTSVHAQLENIFLAANEGLPLTRYLVESTVSVGFVGTTEVTGHADLFDLHTGEVTDWKVVGSTTLRKVRAEGPSETYRRQAHLYGRGFTRRGLTVNRVRIAFLPRNDVTLSGAIIWSEPYDESVAVETLTRASMFAYGIETVGLDQMLALAPPHTGTEYSCARYGNPTSRGFATTADLFTH